MVDFDLEEAEPCQVQLCLLRSVWASSCGQDLALAVWLHYWRDAPVGGADLYADTPSQFCRSVFMTVHCAPSCCPTCLPK